MLVMKRETNLVWEVWEGLVAKGNFKRIHEE